MKKNKSPDSEKETGSGPDNQNQSAAPFSGELEIESGEPANQSAGDACQELKMSLEAKEKDFNALSEKYLRLAAEYDNFRRRSQKEKEALYSDSIALVVKEILPILDNLERAGLSAVQYEHEDARKIADGIAMIQKQADQALIKLGVSAIDCVGQPFDPAFHEAVMHVDDDTIGASTVVSEFQKGYRREDRVIRHSVVTVAN